MDELLQRIGTRSKINLGTYQPLNNRRRPKINEWIRIRIKPTRYHDNIQSHGWITIEIEDIHTVIAENNNLEDYIIKGKLEKQENIVYIKINFNENEDDLDIQARSGWEITEDRMNDEIFKHRIENSQHENNFTQLQTIMSEEEYNESVKNIMHLHEISVEQGNLYTNVEQVKQMYPTCPSRTETPTSSEERDTDDSSLGSQITTISQCLGNQLHDIT